MIIAVNFSIKAIEKKKPEKIRASAGFEPGTSAKYRCDALQLSYEATHKNLESL